MMNTRIDGQQAHNFNSLAIRALPEIGFLAVESLGNGLFQHWVMVGGSSPEADRLGLRLSEEETKHGVFCRPGCLDGRDAPVCRDPKRRCYARGKGAVYSCQHC